MMASMILFDPLEQTSDNIFLKKPLQTRIPVFVSASTIVLLVSGIKIL